MQDKEMTYASRPQFKIERLQDRLLLSAVLEDGSEVIDEVFIEEVPAEEYELVDPLCETIVPEGEWADLMFYTMAPVDGELIDPMPEGTGEEVYFGEENGEIIMVCGFGELPEMEVEILVVDEGTLPDEVLAYTSGMAPDGGVESGAVIAGPEAGPAPAAPGDAVSSDELGSDDLLGGSVGLL